MSSSKTWSNTTVSNKIQPFTAHEVKLCWAIYTSLLWLVQQKVILNLLVWLNSYNYCVQRGTLYIGHLGHTQCLKCKRKNQTCKTIRMGTICYLGLLIKKCIINYQGTDFTETHQLRPQDYRCRWKINTAYQPQWLSIKSACIAAEMSNAPDCLSQLFRLLQKITSLSCLISCWGYSFKSGS